MSARQMWVTFCDTCGAVIVDQITAQRPAGSEGEDMCEACFENAEDGHDEDVVIP